MSAKSFRAKLGAKGHSLFFEVPLDVRKEFGKARPPVKVTINGYTYRSTVSVYGGKYYLPARQERRDEAGLKGGDIIDVKIALGFRASWLAKWRRHVPFCGCNSVSPTALLPSHSF